MHDKLYKLLKETVQFTHANGNHIEISPDVATDAVIKLFADEGYIKPAFTNISIEELRADPKYQAQMTGQEWYDRFQVAKMGIVLETGTQNITRRCVFAAWDKADEAAKRAAGIET